MKRHPTFRAVWWGCNLLLALAILASACSGVWEYSVRKYLKGFSDAVVPEASAPQQKVEAILTWMRFGPPRMEALTADDLSPRDPQDTLNYRQLLEVCGTATNAFLNLSRSLGLQTRRLLLLSPEGTSKHVVAEVLLDGRWAVVDATYRVIIKDAQGKPLTRADLQNPQIFREATSLIPLYRPEYSYERYAHVRVSKVPVFGYLIREGLDRLLPGWDEYVDWSLLLERRSFLYLFFSVTAALFLLLLRSFLAWLADHHLRIPRFHLRTNLGRATAAFFTTPEIK